MARTTVGFLIFLTFASGALAAPPSVTNVSAHQRTDGSKIVDIYYDLADPDTTLLQVSVRISSDGGNSYMITPVSIAGDVGPNVRPGTQRHIVWDCGTDLPGAYGTAYRAAVTASDETAAGANWNMTLPGGGSMEMVYVPAGTFLMGNSNTGGDIGGASIEFPQHPVYLSGYWIGKYEVTRGQYARFMLAGGYYNPEYWSASGWTWKGSRNQPDCWPSQQNWTQSAGPSGPPFTQTDEYPVVASYYEAEAYARWAGCLLPTEAQWEKAARWDGHPRIWPWGDTWDAEKLNGLSDTLYPGWQTAPIGRFPAGMSPYGCYDMAGNLLEWGRDWYQAGYYGLWPSGGWVDPEGPASGSQAVLRGGANNGTTQTRCAYRGGASPGTTILTWPFPIYNRTGFRLAR